MSIQAVAWVLEHSEATLADRLVLIAIANHCDGRGWNAYPAIERIAHEAKVHRATAYRAIEALEVSGELNIQRRPGRASMYGIPGVMGSHPATGEGVASCDPGVANDAQRGRNLRPKPLRTVTQPGPASTEARLPPELRADVKAKGKAFFEQLRKGETA